MNEIKIEYKDKVIKFGINDYKFIISSNYDEIFDIKKAIINYYAKSKKSEYQIENHQSNNVYIDDNLVNLKDSKLYIINKYYDFKNDIKLGSKSLILKYIETKLSQIEYSDNLIMVNNIMKVIAEDSFVETNISLKDLKINLNFEEMGIKILSKLIETSVLNDMYSYNPEELNLKECLIIQLKILQEINSIHKNDLIIIELDYIDDEIFEEIKKINNSKILIFIEELKINIDISKLFILNKDKFDLACDDIIHNQIIMNLPYHINIQELKKKIVDEIIVNKPKILDFFQ